MATTCGPFVHSLRLSPTDFSFLPFPVPPLTKPTSHGTLDSNVTMCRLDEEYILYV